MDVKWIKIDTNIFNDEKILIIEGMDNIDKYAVITVWFKLLCLAGKTNNSGIFIINDRFPYTEEMLASIFRQPLQLVKTSLEIFSTLGMVEIIDNVITIPNWEKHQNEDKLEKMREQTRQRVEKHRERQKLAIKHDEKDCNVTETLHVTLRNATDIDIDKEKDILTISKDIVCQTQSDEMHENVKKVVEEWNKLECYGVNPIKKMSKESTRYKNLKIRIADYGVDDVIYAVNERIAKSDFLLGRVNDFVVTFDWFVKPNNFVKVLEGNYNKRQQTTINTKDDDEGWQ